MRGSGELRGSQPMTTAVHRSLNILWRSTPYLTYGRLSSSATTDKIVTSRTTKKKRSKRQEAAIMHVLARVDIYSNTLIQHRTNGFADSLLTVESAMTISAIIVIFVPAVTNPTVYKP